MNRLCALSTLGAAAGVCLFTGVAFASHIEPASGKKASFSLVNSFFPCSSPNTSTQTGSIPACAPTAPEGVGGCALSPSGSGKLTAALTGSASDGTEDIKLGVVASGLNNFCENDQLCIKLSYRATTDDCPEGSCTTVDVENQAVAACCIVTNGKCKIKTTLLTASPGFLAIGKTTGIELHGCGLKGSAGFVLPPEITCGVLLK